MNNPLNFSDQDISQIEEHGLSAADVEQQIEAFRKGFLPVKLMDAATCDNGIIVLSDKEQKSFVRQFEANAAEYDMAKFVPASGAATRMFRDLFAARLAVSKGDHLPAGAVRFFENISRFAFYGELSDCLQKQGLDLNTLLTEKNYLPILNTLLDADGLNFGAKPKAFIPFHSYGNTARTALEEQIAEGLAHAVGADRIVNIHLTISEEHEKMFLDLKNTILGGLGQEPKIDLAYSFQHKNTDTIAVDLNNNPVRNHDGKLVFRPGGHGALLQNLNELNQEMVFVKNIDNIVPDRHREDTIWYKKVLGGFMMQLIDEIHSFLIMLDDGNVEENDLNDMLVFAEEKLFCSIPPWMKESDPLEKMDFLYTVFNRPVRVCGMVKNEGEPGGGPFYTENSEGEISLQIVESAQIQLNDAQQKKIFESSTHFNPVDLVCWLKDFNGDAFDLNDFSDPETGFVAVKSFEGHDIKAMELPGLWNGAMADWITVFVEVPLSTFNPVKEVNDLLREMHL